MRDFGGFTIPCSIGGVDIGQTLCDLGVSINLMPHSIFKKLGIGEVRPTLVMLQIDDCSFAGPEGIIEDVLINVDKFIMPADFIILDYEADHDVPIILGRPFLPTGRTQIDVHNGDITMRVNEQEMKFNILKALEFPNEADVCHTVLRMIGFTTQIKNEDVDGKTDQQPSHACYAPKVAQKNFEPLNMGD
ncbi:uncharacterized protein LOC120077439 [Benincasa hispida]|uniref:uncharacterized protein LOC120077439 n=1 Tax=Benincasa hispida TaxID=102211 RepID=UPI0018FF8477|nr:uncharacterized protein LOC120077439 [Benincasa hispida]